MTEFEIYCAECRKKFTINDEQFTALVILIEEQTERIASILLKQGVPVSYNTHHYISGILQQLIRCCTKPEIYFCNVKSEEEINKIIEKCKKRRIEEYNRRFNAQKLSQ